MVKGCILKISEEKAVFENLDEGNYHLAVTQDKDGLRKFEKYTKNNPFEINNFQQLPFEAIYGFYDLLSGSYVALVIESEPYIKCKIMNIRKAKKIIIVPLFRSGRTLSDLKQKDEDRYLQLLNLSFSEHQMFFSTSHDITLSQQRLAKLTDKQANEPHWMHAEDKFFWNKRQIQDLMAINADDWIVVFMSGYLELRSEIAIKSDIKIDFLFISRRSKYRQGCRFIKRGIDEQGNTANFVETEQIVLFPDNRLASFVEIRGSIPLIWQSPVHMRYEPNVFIDEDRTKTTQNALKHLEDIQQSYSDPTKACHVVCVNLIDKKKDQGRLGTAFQELIEFIDKKLAANSPASSLARLQVSYEWFDFHDECKKKGKWKNLSKLIVAIENKFKLTGKGISQSQNYFGKLANGQVSSWQTMILRVNCMDNLDRTNVVQSLFARRSLIYQINKEILVNLENPNNLLDTNNDHFESIFKAIWTNNANAISLGYAGTGALKVDFTRTGKRTIKGMMNDGVNSCMRYYINNFTDGIKQDAIDLMLGNYLPQIDATSPFSFRNSQVAVSSHLAKLFTLLVAIFSSFVLLLPSSFQSTWSLFGFHLSEGVQDIGQVCQSNDQVCHSSEAIDRNLRHLQTHFFLSLTITLGICVYMMYAVVKKGSKIGELLVVHPELCPEPLPAGRITSRQLPSNNNTNNNNSPVPSTTPSSE